MKGKPAPPGCFNINTQALSKLMRAAPLPMRRSMEGYHRSLEREFNAALALPSVEPASVMLGIFELVDESITELKQTENGRQAKCRRGCSACCYLHVTVTRPEALIALQAASDAEWPIDMERVLLQATKHDDDEWHELPADKRRCVFLTDAGECAIYQYRPLACRRYLVVSDPADCDSVSKPGHEVQQVVSAQAEMAASAALEVFESDTFAAMLWAELQEAP